MKGKVMCDHFNISWEIIKKPVEGNLFFILVLDQKKAYDYISRDYLWAIMTACGLDDLIIHMTKCLYVKTKVQVKVNEVLMDSFESCPLSTALYILAISLFNSQDY